MNDRWSGAVLFLLCIALRPFAEMDPVVHVLAQLPLLAIAGYLLSPRLELSPTFSVTLAIVAVTATGFWMLPRYIDLALAVWWVDAAKFLTVPIFVGGALALSWPRLPGLVRPFLKAQALSMLGVLGFVYIHAPVRICNAYLQSDQVRVGVGFLIVAGVLTLLWITPVFTGRAFRAPAVRDDRISI